MEKKNIMGLQPEVKYRVGELTIHKWVSGYAYARNGNAHNPTPQVSWVSVYRGRVVDRAAKLSDIKASAAEVLAEVSAR